MTATDRGRRSDALYYDKVSRRELCDMIANLETDNAKLRELVRDMYKSMDVSCQFGHAIPVGTMAHVKNRAIGLGIEVDT